MLAPFDDKSWEIWVLGNRSDKYPRIDRLFEIHEDRSEHKQPEYDNYLLAKGIPVVAADNFPDGPHVSRFPYQEASRMLGMYFTSSPSYMMALAIMEGVQHIGLWGCDMAVDDHEYFYQRPCMEAWVGYAKGLGIEITIPDESPLGKSSYVEGKDHGKNKKHNGSPFSQKQFMALAQEHQGRMDKLKEEMGALERSIVAHDGARQAYERMAATARAIEAGQPIGHLKDTVRLK